jgi:hypothetical protein
VSDEVESAIVRIVGRLLAERAWPAVVLAFDRDFMKGTVEVRARCSSCGADPAPLATISGDTWDAVQPPRAAWAVMAGPVLPTLPSADERNRTIGLIAECVARQIGRYPCGCPERCNRHGDPQSLEDGE